MSASRRVQRVEKELLQIVSSYLLIGLKDPLNGVVTVSRVQVSPDLRLAKVFVTMLADEDETKENFKTLERRAADFQREISSKLPMRFCPKVSFIRDKGMENSQRIHAILEQVKVDSKKED